MRGSIHAFATDERRPEHGGSLRLARRLRHGAMATNYALTHATATAELAPRLTVAEEVAKFVRTKPLGAAGAAIILAMMAVAGFAEPLAPYDPYRGDYGLQFARPSADHWFGTDEFGRDILSRIMYGAPRPRVIIQHIVPNVMAPYIIILTAQLGGAILAEAALSYLGLGTAEPTPSWGLMLSGSAPSYAEKAPWIGLFPGIAISLGVFGFNLFGDSLRDALDPKLRGR